MARQRGASDERGAVRRIGVFVDYWYAYTTARQLFARPAQPGDPPPPPWFGNVSPRALAQAVVKRPPAGSRRSERQLAGLHLFVRHFDPQVHHGQLDRVRRWELEGAAVTVGPPPAEGGGHWQSAVSVALATAVVEALARGTYDSALVFAGDGALRPMFAALAGEAEPSAAIELATWVAPDGTAPTALAALPHVWCHRLGEATFRQLLDDRRPSHHAAAAKAAGRPRGGTRSATAPTTAMAEALAAAGIEPGTAVPPAASPGPRPESAESALAEDDPGGVRRLAHRLFGKGA